MNQKDKVLGCTLATAAALAFATLPATPTFAECAEPVMCYGSNSCRGSGSCKTNTTSCRCENACRGQGITFESSEEACLNAGGTTTRNYQGL